MSHAQHIDDALLASYALGSSTPEERERVQRAVAHDAELAARLAAISDAWLAVAESLPEAEPELWVKTRLFSTLTSPRRWFSFAPDLATHFDLAVGAVERLLERIETPEAWQAGPMPGIFVMHFAGGPNAAGPDTGFVRLAAGLQFPMHRHLGNEVNYVLEGALIDGDGTRYGPGGAIVKATGSQHEFRVGDEREALIAVAQTGFELVGA